MGKEFQLRQKRRAPRQPSMPERGFADLARREFRGRRELIGF